MGESRNSCQLAMEYNCYSLFLNVISHASQTTFTLGPASARRKASFILDILAIDAIISATRRGGVFISYSVTGPPGKVLANPETTFISRKLPEGVILSRKTCIPCTYSVKIVRNFSHYPPCSIFRTRRPPPPPRRDEMQLRASVVRRKRRVWLNLPR